MSKAPPSKVSVVGTHFERSVDVCLQAATASVFFSPGRLWSCRRENVRCCCVTLRLQQRSEHPCEGGGGAVGRGTFAGARL